MTEDVFRQERDYWKAVAGRERDRLERIVRLSTEPRPDSVRAAEDLLDDIWRIATEADE